MFSITTLLLLLGLVVGITFIIYTINNEGLGLAIAFYLLLLAGMISPTMEIDLQSYITSVSIFGILLIVGIPIIHSIHKLDLILSKAIIGLLKKYDKLRD